MQRRAWLKAAAGASALAASRSMWAATPAETALKAATGPDWGRWQGATPSLSLPDLQGRTHTLDAARGRVIVLSFWASWCEPCRDEFPAMSALAAQWHERGFEIWAVNRAESRARIDEFLARWPIRATVLHDRNGTAARDWQAVAMPANYLIDRSGQVRHWHLGALDWTRPAVLAEVEQLLG